MARLIGNTLPLPYLRRSEVINGAPAKAEIPRILGGNARFMREWITGQETYFGTDTDKDPPCAPITGNCPNESAGLNVRPGPGHDHSGGVMGTPIVRTVWFTTYGDIDNGQIGGMALKTSLSTSNTNVDLCNTKISALWVPWSMSDGAYASLEWRAWMHATATHNYAVEVSCSATGDRVYKEGTYTVGDNYQRLTLDREIAMKPGRFNHFFCKINVSYAAASSVVHCLAWGLFQTKTTA